MLSRETSRLPPMRDIGLTCYKALEASKSGKRKGSSGGSVIRAAPSLKRRGGPGEEDIKEE